MKLPIGCWMILAGLLAQSCAIAVAQQDDSVLPPYGPFAEPETGVRVQVDGLIWTRNTNRSAQPIIGGPERFSLDQMSNNTYTGGYRVACSYLIDPNYEFEGVWTQFNDWATTGAGVLNRAVALNGGQASTLVDPSGNANFINQGTYFRPLFDAATDTLGNPPLKNYDFLRGPSQYSMHSASNLGDFQANFKTRRSSEQRYSFGLGYRNIHLGDNADAAITGIFGTNDIPGGGNTHNILTDQALTAHGLTLLSGAADGFTNGAGAPTTLSMIWNGTTRNQLNGFQGTFDAILFERNIFILEGLVRAGLFYNQMSGTVQEVVAGGGADNSVYGQILNDRKDAVAFAGNAGLNGLFQLTNHFRIRTGYEAMFITNAAMAGNQQQGVSYNAASRPFYSLQSGTPVILHGFRIGMEVVW